MSTSAEVRPAAGGGASLRGLGYLSFTALTWGINWPVMKFLLSEVSPYQMRMLTCLIGAGFTFALARVQGERMMPPPGQWSRLVVSTWLNFSAFMICSVTAMHWLSASEAVIVAYTLPIWAALLAWPMLGERPTLIRWAALMIGIAGIAVLMGPELRASWSKLPGLCFGLVGAILFALGIVITKRRPVLMPPVSAVAWQILLGAAPLLLLALTLERPTLDRLSGLGWAGVFYLSLLPLSLAYLAWFRALHLLAASTAAIATLVVPVVGVFASALMLSEPLGVRQIGALGLTLGGVALATRA